MLKLAGAASIILSSLLAALTYIRTERKRLDEIAEMRALTAKLFREMCERVKPLPEIIGSMARGAGDGCAAGFCGALLRGLERIGEEDISAIWSKAVSDTLAQLGERSERALCRLGEVIGCSDIERQRDAAELCISELSEAESSGRAELKERSRLCTGLALCAGVFTVIMLV